MSYRELGFNDMKNKMAVKSTFRSSNPSESFQSKTFQFSLGKVCKALEKFHKAQRSHQHATDAPPTHLVPCKFKEWPTRRPTVGRQLAVCRPSVGRLLTDCWPTVDRRVGRRVYRRVGGIGFFTFTVKTVVKTHIKTSSIQIHLIVSDIFILLGSFSTALQEKTVRTSPETK